MLCFGSPVKDDDDDFSSRKCTRSRSSDSRGGKKKGLTRAASTPTPISIPPSSKTSLTPNLSLQPTSSSTISPFSTSPQDGKAATSAGSPTTTSPSGSTSSTASRGGIASKRLQTLKSAKGINAPQAHPLPCPDSGPVPKSSKPSTPTRSAVSAPTTPAPILIPKSPLGLPPASSTPKGAPSPSSGAALGRCGSHPEVSTLSSESRALSRGQSMPQRTQDSPSPKEGVGPTPLKPGTQGKAEGVLVRSSSCKEASPSEPTPPGLPLPAASLGVSGHTIPEEQGSSGDLKPGSSKATQNKVLTLETADLSQLVNFSHKEMAEATEQFSEDCMIGEGGFGPVYQGWVHHTRLKGSGFVAGKSVTSKGYIAVAIKILKADSHQGEKEWLAEVSYLGHLRHLHLVRLLGYCVEGRQRMLVYEYMPRGSLEFLLFTPSAPPSPSSDDAGGGLEDEDVRVLTWHERITVALGAAKGLAFLHEEVQPGVIYRDLKTSNILLDDNLNAKLSDFGLARDGPQGDCTHVSTRIVGTVGYAAPEYVMTGHLTNKSDIYAFGVVLLELLTGRLAMDKRRPKDEQSLVEWAEPYLEHPGKLYRIMDQALKGKYSVKGAQAAAAVVKGCLNRRPKQRPKMSAVVKALQPLLELHDMAGFVPSAMPSPRSCPTPILGFEGGPKLGKALHGEGRGDGVVKGVMSPRQAVMPPTVSSARA